MSKIVEKFEGWLLEQKLKYTKEYKFHPTRKWRFDFAFPEQKIAIEIEGGIWTNGAHTRGAHYNSDCDKYNAAIDLGWKVFRFTTNHIKNREFDILNNSIELIKITSERASKSKEK